MHRLGARRELTLVVGEKDSFGPELCSVESVCGQAFFTLHTTRGVFTSIGTLDGELSPNNFFVLSCSSFST